MHGRDARATIWENKKSPENILRGFFNERLAATYSRGSYTTTTIGLAVLDGRVRNGNGSDHCGIATKVLARGPRELPLRAGQKLSDAQKLVFKRSHPNPGSGDSLKTIHRSLLAYLQLAS